MIKPIYTGPRQTISIKVKAGKSAGKNKAPAIYKEVKLIAGMPLEIDPKTELYASLKLAGFIREDELPMREASSRNKEKS